ncbi:hypothetical protein [Arsenicicoccus piscis]|uniref:Uncharacterized protein n=1 Tax=Arsenicicoccus piscis TaxID=673954 RepID=A0ABQ6HKP5_9MICO|nr:hypothetical protein [Arsenicicoccus piscis]GMA18218.1 hypothetical protein GCM10025862_02390 [Arsenicicoccus piscis]
MHYFDAGELEALCRRLGLELVSSTSFPFPTWAGKLFIYNEFWVRARYAGSSPT